MKDESGSSRFQPGEGPSRGLLRDYEPSDLLRMELFEALVTIAEPCSSYTLCLHFLIERGVSPVNCQYTAQQGHCRDLQTDLELGSYRRTMYCNGGFDF